MLKPKITTLPGHIQSVFVQNIMKLFGSILKSAEENEDQETMKELCQLLTNKLPIFIQSADLEVQERVSSAVSFCLICTCKTLKVVLNKRYGYQNLKQTKFWILKIICVKFKLLCYAGLNWDQPNYTPLPNLTLNCTMKAT